MSISIPYNDLQTLKRKRLTTDVKKIPLKYKINPQLLYEELNFKYRHCGDCIGIMENPVPICYFNNDVTNLNNFCINYWHQCKTNYSLELKISVYWIEFVDGKLRLFCEKIGMHHFIFLAKYFHDFIRLSILGIEIHHGNENCTDNSMNSLFAKYSDSHNDHTFIGKNLRHFFSLFIENKKEIKKMLKSCISINTNGEKISGTVYDFEDLFLRVFIDSEKNEYLQELLKCNKSFHMMKHVAGHLNSCLLVRDLLNCELENKKTEFSLNQKSCFNDSRAMDDLYKIQKEIDKYDINNRILNNEFKLPSGQTRIILN